MASCCLFRNSNKLSKTTVSPVLFREQKSKENVVGVESEMRLQAYVTLFEILKKRTKKVTKMVMSSSK